MTAANSAFSILVIEDNAGDYVLVEDYIRERIPFPEITLARTYHDLSSIFAERTKPFDVILLDLSLPDKSGMDLLTGVLGFCMDTPVIVLTSFTNIDFSIGSISQGASDYLIKDELSPSVLYKSIVYCLERRKHLDQLRESEFRYSNLFNQSPQAMCLYDPVTLQFAQVNKAAMELYGYPEDEFLLMTVNEITREKDDDDPPGMNKVLHAGFTDFYKGTFTHYKKSGELMLVEVYSNSIVLRDKIYRSVIAIDVTEQREMETRIARAIIKTQEEERYEIGSELHDNVCQILAICQMTMGMIRSHLDPVGESLFDQSTGYIQQATTEIRNLSHRLAPAFFDDTTLREAIEIMVRNFNVEKKYSIRLSFEPLLATTGINPGLQLNMYRILQEQLRNISKYAKATNIEVMVGVDKRFLNMVIKDDGVGFDSKVVSGGIGMANMKRRTELFSGSFDIESSIGKGCEINVRIPLEQAQVEGFI